MGLGVLLEPTSRNSVILQLKKTSVLYQLPLRIQISWVELMKDVVLSKDVLVIGFCSKENGGALVLGQYGVVLKGQFFAIIKHIAAISSEMKDSA